MFLRHESQVKHRIAGVMDLESDMYGGEKFTTVHLKFDVSEPVRATLANVSAQFHRLLFPLLFTRYSFTLWRSTR